MAVVAQLVRALDCDSKCRGFKSRQSPFLPLLHPIKSVQSPPLHAMLPS